MFEYVIVLIPFALATIVTLLKHPNYRKIVLVESTLCVILGMLWDYIILALWKIWSWNPDKTLPFWIFGLPLEEWLCCLVIASAVACGTLLLHESFSSS